MQTKLWCDTSGVTSFPTIRPFSSFSVVNIISWIPQALLKKLGGGCTMNGPRQVITASNSGKTNLRKLGKRVPSASERDRSSTCQTTISGACVGTSARADIILLWTSCAPIIQFQIQRLHHSQTVLGSLDEGELAERRSIAFIPSGPSLLHIAQTGSGVYFTF